MFVIFSVKLTPICMALTQRANYEFPLAKPNSRQVARQVTSQNTYVILKTSKKRVHHSTYNVFLNNNCGMCVVESEWWRYLVAGVKILVVGERQVRGALVEVRGGGGGTPPPVPRGYNSARVTL